MSSLRFRGLVTRSLIRHVIPAVVLLYLALSLILFSHTANLDRDPLRIESQQRNLIPTLEDRSFDPNEKVLALLFPPGMVGGYRNQVIRFIGLIFHAKANNIRQLVLPSLLWSTTYDEAHDQSRFFPIPMESLFDVDRWNSFSDLPRLVDTVENSDCWNVDPSGNIQDATIPPAAHHPKFQRFQSPLREELVEKYALLTPIQNISRQVIQGTISFRPHKLDLLPHVQNCTRPYIFGGGTKGGKLWHTYMAMTSIPSDNNWSDKSIQKHNESTRLISLVSEALQPAPEWRALARQCVGRNLSNLVVLHARIEVDMMIHRCAAQMEMNLTNILAMVESFTNQPVMIAVSRYGMQHRPAGSEGMVDLIQENWDTLLAKTRSTQLLECGEEWMKQWYSEQPSIPHNYYGSILPSIMNFYLATHAETFIGVSRSSWSIDVWTTRYYQGKGATNYEYTPQGIIPVPNGGLPTAHRDCKNGTFSK